MSQGQPADTRYVILDASFIRSCPANGDWLARLIGMGYQLVATDHLAFELCSGDHPEQWAAAQRKLAPFVEHVHAWHSTGVMVRFESENQRPFPHPGFQDSTDRLRHLLRTNPGFLPDDIAARAEQEGQIRDVAGPESVYRSLMALRPLAQAFSQLIRGMQPEAASPHCEAFVRNDNNVRALLDMAEDFPPGAHVNDQWVIWHVFRAHLAICCEYMRQANDDLFALPENALRRWVNRTHDCDYVTQLAFGSVLASQEIAGEQFWFRRWMYGGARPQVHFDRQTGALEILT